MDGLNVFNSNACTRLFQLTIVKIVNIFKFNFIIDYYVYEKYDKSCRMFYGSSNYYKF